MIPGNSLSRRREVRFVGMVPLENAEPLQFRLDRGRRHDGRVAARDRLDLGVS
jgi:hypothetical protein